MLRPFTSALHTLFETKSPSITRFQTLGSARGEVAPPPTPAGPSPFPSPVGRGVICEVTPTRLPIGVVGSFFSHRGHSFLSQSAQSSRSFLAHISSPQKASGIQSSQSVTAKVGTNKGQQVAYILLIGVSR